MRAALHNLGCKVNAYELDIIQQKLEEKGYEIVSFDSEADIYIVNTCTVTNIADRKSRQMLHQARKRNPAAVVVAVGCYVQTGTEQVLQDAGVDLVIGNHKKGQAAELIEAFLAGRTAAENSKNPEKDSDPQKENLEALAAAKTLGGDSLTDIGRVYEYEEMTLQKTAEHTRAYIKIQDGCNQFCSYCIIPYARGRVRSRHYEDILKEVRGLVAAGYQEIVLTGIHISSYGIDFEDDAWEKGECVNRLKSDERHDYSGAGKLIDMLERLAKESGIRRIRLGSLEPRIITEDTAKRLAAISQLCPHFHLSLQSGCDATLRRMNRHYTAAEYAQSVAELRRAFDHPAITTDVIVGFPQETEEEFAETVRFLEDLALYEMHIFKYSARKGTVAAGMKGQLTEAVKGERSDVLLSMTARHSAEYRRAWIGRRAEVLFEEEKEVDGRSYWVGHTGEYVKAALMSGENLENRLLTCEITGMLTDEIVECRCAEGADTENGTISA
ncbi:MAG: tRNA (N(6)-L-threonylcarbamoyladenosine(37)-C(2))-methylthiotransferase MtaB [Lachnospiraceae bacterium]|nr:tRNA (N(6)-L-threonylcarbamoyladenosine(37)-C(2))-methylthiotransferase MtaB [Lachnospiraceae bacterium]